MGLFIYIVMGLLVVVRLVVVRRLRFSKLGRLFLGSSQDRDVKTGVILGASYLNSNTRPLKPNLPLRNILRI